MLHTVHVVQGVNRVDDEDVTGDVTKGHNIKDMMPFLECCSDCEVAYDAKWPDSGWLSQSQAVIEAQWSVRAEITRRLGSRHC